MLRNHAISPPRGQSNLGGSLDKSGCEGGYREILKGQAAGVYETIGSGTDEGSPEGTTHAATATLTNTGQQLSTLLK